MTFDELKAKHRALRSGFPQSVDLRVHRALSWLKRAEQETDDHDSAFVFYWIGFNAAYAADVRELEGERLRIDEFFRKLTSLDDAQRIYDAIWETFSQAIRSLLDNRFVFDAFWKHQNRVPGHADWHKRFKDSKERTSRALATRDTHAILATLFDRLYVLRNQLVHGGATWSGARNRNQVRDGARIMAVLVPVFIDIIMDNPEVDWGEPHYPVVE
jgi:hypothetical protein